MSSCVLPFAPLCTRVSPHICCKVPDKKTPTRMGWRFAQVYYWYQNWFMVLSLPAAFRAASPLKYSLWSSPMSEPDMFWCLTQAMP